VTVKAKYTLTEAHFKIAELEKELEALKKKHEKLILEVEDLNAEPAEFVI
jgi:cell division protein FtsB